MLNGVSLGFNTVNNVISTDQNQTYLGAGERSADFITVRNLKLIPPKDCFPAPEKVEPDTAWNARYDAL